MRVSSTLSPKAFCAAAHKAMSDPKYDKIKNLESMPTADQASLLLA